MSDSWEAINAKLQYEKHLQDNAGGNNTPTGPILGKPNDSLLRSQFYQNGGSSSNSNFNNQPSSQNGSPRVSMASGGKIQDLQSNFGEILNPAPAAFSPQFTNKNFRRSNGGKPSILVSGGSTSADDEGAGAGAEGSSGGAAWKRKPLLSPEKPHKSVFIKAFGEGEGGTAAGEGGEAMGKLLCGSFFLLRRLPINLLDTVKLSGVSPSHSADNAHHEGQHSLSASHDGTLSCTYCFCLVQRCPRYSTFSLYANDLCFYAEDPPSGEKKQFLNKRAGHYNEFKVLQAMRAKLAAEEEEEDETDS